MREWASIKLEQFMDLPLHVKILIGIALFLLVVEVLPILLAFLLQLVGLVLGVGILTALTHIVLQECGMNGFVHEHQNPETGRTTTKVRVTGAFDKRQQ